MKLMAAKDWKVLECVIDDPVSGLTIQLEMAPDGWPVMRIAGECLPNGNRDFIFRPDGSYDGTGTSLGIVEKPTFAVNIDELFDKGLGKTQGE